MYLSDHQITKRCEGSKPMIEPFVNCQAKWDPKVPPSVHNELRKIISYGLSSYGYDARLDNTFLFPKFDPASNPVIDPKNTNVSDYAHVVRDVIEIPPHSFVLGQTMEYFRIPRDVLALCIGKSTYARCGIIVNVTPLEPEWEGQVTIEISNTNVKPARIYAGEGIAQFLFGWCGVFEVIYDLVTTYGENWAYNVAPYYNNPKISYADRKGKYQGQTEVTPSKL
jgi:dCTP deaminase